MLVPTWALLLQQVLLTCRLLVTGPSRQSRFRLRARLPPFLWLLYHLVGRGVLAVRLPTIVRCPTGTWTAGRMRSLRRPITSRRPPRHRLVIASSCLHLHRPVVPTVLNRPANSQPARAGPSGLFPSVSTLPSRCPAGSNFSSKFLVATWTHQHDPPSSQQSLNGQAWYQISIAARRFICWPRRTPPTPIAMTDDA